MRDKYLQDCNSEIENSSRARTYRLFCSFGLNKYWKCEKIEKKLNLSYVVLECQHIYE